MVDVGYPLSEVARRLGLDRKTVRRYRDTSFEVPLASTRDRRNIPLDRFKPYLQAEFAAGNTVATELYQQIRERGFRGVYSTLSHYVGTLRDGTAVPAPAPIPAPRTITGWIMRPRENLPPRETHALEQVRRACPDITKACNLARSFAGFLRQDIDAVTAGLTLPTAPAWSRATSAESSSSIGACTAAHPSHSSERGFSPHRDTDPRAETQLGLRGDSLRGLQISFHCRACSAANSGSGASARRTARLTPHSLHS
ncbi:hypothetical protein [Streptomyces mirabilis]|uniref:hypothetical protein n=1 Tax=Streptomyces mirabilis TaxID=68239 RepID=UPI00331DE23C